MRICVFCHSLSLNLLIMILYSLMLIPVLGIVLVNLITSVKSVKQVALAVTILEACISVVLYLDFDLTTGGYQFVSS